jgi:hypothetical protein
MLTLHAAPNGYALAFVDGDRRETLARFPTFDAAARALRAAEAAASKLVSLQSYNLVPKLRP